jgi:hypothetical protein
LVGGQPSFFLLNDFIIYFLFFFFSFLLLYWVGTQCGIYKSSYNISNVSYLNSPTPWFSFISPLPPK